MKVLVTGATGFLGSYIVDKCIAQGDSVRVLVRKTSNVDYLKKYPDIEYAYGDLTDTASLKEATKGVDVIYHSAARVTAVGDRAQFYKDNVTSTQCLVDEAKQQGVKRFVFVSSPSIFFDFTDQNDIDETYPYPKKYINLYSETKALAEQYVLSSNDENFTTCSLRPRGIWGPRDKTGYIPKILLGMTKQKFPDMSGGKEIYATLCHVENAADACVLAARSDKVGGKAYFITDDEIVNVWDFLGLLAKTFSIPAIQKKVSPRLLMFLGGIFDLIWKIPALARKIDPPLSRYAVGLLTYTSTYNISAAKRDFGYNPRVNQRTGLPSLKQWVEDIGGLETFLSPLTSTTQGSTPLRQFKDLPGPRPLPIVGNALQIKITRLHQDVEAWAKQYGSVFRMRLGPTNVLVIADHKVEASLLKDRPDGFRRPAQLVDTIEEMGLKSGVLTAEGQAWKHQRRMVMASFAPGNVRSYFPSLIKVTQRLRGRWHSAAETGTAVELQEDLMRFTVDAVAGLAFGSDINTLETNDDVIQQHLDKILPALFKRVNAIVPYWRYLKLPADRQLDRSVAIVNDSINEFILQARERLDAEPARREQPTNLLESMIVAADQPDSGVNNDDVAGNVMTMLLAGEETTATTISWLIYLLERNPQALKRAQEEVDRVVGDLNELTPEKLAELKFIEACTLETLRLKPTGPFNVLVALKDTEVAGVEVPKGMWIWSVCRHDTLQERYFPDPNAFSPQRWLDNESMDIPQARRVSMPFGSGPRVCPGRYLAMLEIKLAMAMLLKDFEIESVSTPDGGEAKELMSITMTPVGLAMKLRKRL